MVVVAVEKAAQAHLAPLERSKWQLVFVRPLWDARNKRNDCSILVGCAVALEVVARAHFGDASALERLREPAPEPQRRSKCPSEAAGPHRVTQNLQPWTDFSQANLDNFAACVYASIEFVEKTFACFETGWDQQESDWA